MNGIRARRVGRAHASCTDERPHRCCPWPGTTRDEDGDDTEQAIWGRIQFHKLIHFSLLPTVHGLSGDNVWVDGLKAVPPMGPGLMWVTDDATEGIEGGTRGGKEVFGCTSCAPGILYSKRESLFDNHPAMTDLPPRIGLVAGG